MSSLTSLTMSFTYWTFWLLVVLDFGSASNRLPTSKGKLNEPARLYCEESCPGVVRWHRKSEKVAACGQGAESGLKLTCEVNQRNITIIIPQVNYSTRGYYWATCDDKEMFNCRLFLLPYSVESAVEPEPGEPLRLDLHTSEPVIISFMKSGGSSSPIQICTVLDKRVLQCMNEYEERVLIVGNTFVLMHMTSSDSGNYTVQENDGFLVSTSHVTVKDVRRSSLYTNGYWKGFVTAALCFGTAGLIVGVCLGKFVLPQTLSMVTRGVERIRLKYFTPIENCDEDIENGHL